MTSLESDAPLVVGVLTSGGDSPGMNAAVRAVVRTCLRKEVKIYAIREGYSGMIQGDIVESKWSDVGGILHKGGTAIGTARSMEFVTREGRKKAVFELLKRGINGLVVIGGDGSLTAWLTTHVGASILKNEWPSLVQELEAEGKTFAPNQRQLSLVGLVGSIDNDMCGTDLTIGTDTALHRITDAIDCLTSTAASHKRVFVVEIMGRNCGYLTLMAGLISGSDYIFIPECPPPTDWQQDLINRVEKGRELGTRCTIILVAEGALDRGGKPITSEMVKDTLERKGLTTRITVLGHVQRGGSPSAVDRCIASVMGYHAVCCLLEEQRNKATLIGMKGHKIIKLPLSESLQLNAQVATALKELDFDRAKALRGKLFEIAHEAFLLATKRASPPKGGKTIGIMHTGASAPGMNTAVRIAVRSGIGKGYRVVGIMDGFDGLAKDNVKEMAFMDVNGWAPNGGALLGTNRTLPSSNELHSVVGALRRNKIDALMIIGGYESYRIVHDLAKICTIPILVIPATISNNCPATDYSIGCDRALTNLMEAADKIKQSAVHTKRLFIVEAMGNYCGYLSLMGGLVCGGERVYLAERPIHIEDLQRDADMLIKRFSNTFSECALYVRNEKASDLFTTSFLSSLFTAQGEGFLDVRTSILGHLQQGGNPTPTDRIHASIMAHTGLCHLCDLLENDKHKSGCLGLIDGEVRITDAFDIVQEMNDKYRVPRTQWWEEWIPIFDTLAQPTAAIPCAKPSHLPKKPQPVPSQPFPLRKLGLLGAGFVAGALFVIACSRSR